MENATDALKIAFAIFVFVIAITILFSLVSQAKATADVVLYHSDKTNFYSHVASQGENRTVSYAEVVSTLYRYYKESICVTIDLGKNDVHTFDLGNSVGNSDGNIKGVEDNLKNFIKEKLEKYSDKMFTEKFTEAPVGGIYSTGEDGSQITLSSGMKKIYVTYTLILN
ncbi:MAG: hypothetical protein Q4G09_01180 [Clostridia bacterium]|nr:hypothetical protein [Clostridia bacterium]